MTATSANTWLEINKDGFADVLADMEPARILAELVSNAYDEQATRVDIEIRANARRGLTTFTVEDDSPAGFDDLRHSYTLFAPSKKKGDPTKSGRFNFGEKVVLAICQSAEIASTEGAVRFNADGTREFSETRRAAGTKVTINIEMGASARADLIRDMKTLLPRLPTYVNGEPLASRVPLLEAPATLPIQIADASGRLRRKRRATTIQVFEPLDPARGGTIYELGMPIVTTGDRYDVNVMQKVPVPLDRSNVPTDFLRELRVAVLNATSQMLDEDAAAKPWVSAALPGASPEAVRAVISARFGDKVVSYSVKDPEANSRATAAGYVVLAGGALSGDAWQAVKRIEAVVPASAIFPTHGESVPGRTLPQSEWTEGMRYVVDLTKRLAPEVIGRTVSVQVVSSPRSNVRADYGDGTLRFNLDRLGHRFFSRENLPAVLDLICHELAHEIEANHLSDRFANSLSRFAGVLVKLALERPEIYGAGS